ncbi:class I SAM-dependent methyltransferase [bacterium]|nr:class I SAM-dependent methyltransferase [bacterium]
MKVCAECGKPFNGVEWTCPACSFSPSFDGKIPLFSPALASENDGFCVDYFDVLQTLEENNFWFRARNDLIISVLRKFCPSMRRFMEIGCGTGFVMSAVASEFKNAEITGTEIFSKGLIHAAKRVTEAQLIQADARHLPYDSHFDVIGAFDVLEHIEDDVRVMGQVYKALRPDGLFLLTVPQHDSFVSLLLPLLWLFRRRFRAAQQSDALIELRIGSIANKLLSTVMRIEALLYAAGVRFSAGGSLLIAARKTNL